MVTNAIFHCRFRSDKKALKQLQRRYVMRKKNPKSATFYTTIRYTLLECKSKQKNGYIYNIITFYDWIFCRTYNLDCSSL